MGLDDSTCVKEIIDKEYRRNVGGVMFEAKWLKKFLECVKGMNPEIEVEQLALNRINKGKFISRHIVINRTSKSKKSLVIKQNLKERVSKIT